MKNKVYSLIAILLACTVLYACKKSSGVASVNGKLVVSKSTILVNEPDSIQLTGVTASDNVKWNVSPAGSSYLVTKNNKAMIIFNKTGSYTLSVSFNGAAPATGAIAVTDSVPHPGVQYTITPLTGDQVTLVPHFYKSTAADSSYLYFIAQTKNNYCEESTMHVSSGFDNGSYSMGFLDVIQPSPCPLGDGPLGWAVNFTNQAGPQPNGTFPLSVTLNGTTYTGSIVVTSTTITYNWSYTSGVLISPKQISR